MIKHVGCASAPAAIEALQVKAKEEFNHLHFKNQLALFPNLSQPGKAKLLSWRITGYHQVFGSVYDRIGFPPGLLRDLVIARIVYPKSKLATIRYLNRYLGLSFKKDVVYRSLDRLDKDKLAKIAYRFVSGKNKSSLTLVFYDVTTLYFETDREDNYRQKGFSKEHRHDMPQILIGLFVDKDGYPFDYDFFEGKTFEGHTFKKAVNRLLTKYSFKDLTVVADAGMLSYDNLSFLDSQSLYYIVAARLKNLPQKIIKLILSHDFLSSPIYETSWQNKRLVVDYSAKRAKRDRQNRKRLIKALELRLSKKQTVIRKSKYLKVYGKEKALGIDRQKIKQDQQFDGLKGYLSNQQDLPADEISKQYRNLWQVEKAFRMSKNDLKERPVYHFRLKRIQSHLLLCFISLLVMKETESILKEVNFSIEKTIELLGKVGQGLVKIGKTQLEIDSELDQETKNVLKLFVGH